MEEIYRKIESLEDKTCEVGISYLEVYNETVRDLLAPAGILDIRETGNSTAIPGLSMHKPTGPENILSLLTFGKFGLLYAGELSVTSAYRERSPDSARHGRQQ